MRHVQAGSAVFVTLLGTTSCSARDSDGLNLVSEQLWQTLRHHPLLCAAGLAVLLLIVFYRRWRRGHDLTYKDLPPGALPSKSSPHGPPVKAVWGKSADLVCPAPPEDLPPGELGFLVDASATDQHISAMLMDLALRGHFLILPGPPEFPDEDTISDWIFDAPASPAEDPLLPYEVPLVEALFSKGPTARLSDVEHNLSLVVPKVRRSLLREIDKKGLFQKKLGSFTALIRSAATKVLFAAAAVLAFVSVIAWGNYIGDEAWTSTANAMLGGIYALVFVIFSAGWVLTTGTGRTARGRALYEQALGFRRYLLTIDLKRLEQDQDPEAFDRHLPYAVALSTGNRWGNILNQLDRQGFFSRTKRDADPGGAPSPMLPMTANLLAAHFPSAFSSSVSGRYRTKAPRA